MPHAAEGDSTLPVEKAVSPNEEIGIRPQGEVSRVIKVAGLPKVELTLQPQYGSFSGRPEMAIYRSSVEGQSFQQPL